MNVWLCLLICISSCLCDTVTIGDRADDLIPESWLLEDGRIVGGWPVNISLHPHQVSLHNWHRHSCGGSLISPNWILTAAHCTSAGVAGYSFRLGTRFWNVDGVLISAAQVINHPLYNYSNLDYDISLVKLSRYQNEVEDIIRYVSLPPPGWEPRPGSIATVTGWGTPYSGGSLMDELQEVRVPIVSRETCQEYYLDYSIQTNRFITERMLCAGFVDGGADACQGDSGGPLIVDGYLTGIVSWGYLCAWPGYPGVYASVPNLLSWIREHTGL